MSICFWQKIVCCSQSIIPRCCVVSSFCRPLDFWTFIPWSYFDSSQLQQLVARCVAIKTASVAKHWQHVNNTRKTLKANVKGLHHDNTQSVPMQLNDSVSLSSDLSCVEWVCISMCSHVGLCFVLDADRWRHWPCLRDRTTVPQRRHRYDTQPRVYDVRVLHGVCRLQWSHPAEWNFTPRSV